MDGQLLASSQHCSAFLVQQSTGSVVRKLLYCPSSDFLQELKIQLQLAKAAPACFPAVLRFDTATKEVILEYCERQFGMDAFELVLKALQAVKAMHDHRIVHCNLSSRSLLPTGNGLKLTGFKKARCVKGDNTVFRQDLVSLGKALSSMLEEPLPGAVRHIVEWLITSNMSAGELVDLMVRVNPELPLSPSLQEARCTQVSNALARCCKDQPFREAEVMQWLEQFFREKQVSGLICVVKLEQSGVTCKGCNERLAVPELASLPCGHRLCRPCVKRHLGEDPRCPCGQPFNISHEGVKSFVTARDQPLSLVSANCPRCKRQQKVKREKAQHQCPYCGRCFCACCLQTEH